MAKKVLTFFATLMVVAMIVAGVFFCVDWNAARYPEKGIPIYFPVHVSIPATFGSFCVAMLLVVWIIEESCE